MKAITGLIGRDDRIETIAREAREARKGRHLLLTGRVGIGKSAVLAAVAISLRVFLFKGAGKAN